MNPGRPERPQAPALAEAGSWPSAAMALAPKAPDLPRHSGTPDTASARSALPTAAIAPLHRPRGAGPTFAFGHRSRAIECLRGSRTRPPTTHARPGGRRPRACGHAERCRRARRHLEPGPSAGAGWPGPLRVPSQEPASERLTGHIASSTSPTTTPWSVPVPLTSLAMIRNSTSSARQDGAEAVLSGGQGTPDVVL